MPTGSDALLMQVERIHFNPMTGVVGPWIATSTKNKPLKTQTCDCAPPEHCTSRTCRIAFAPASQCHGMTKFFVPKDLTKELSYLCKVLLAIVADTWEAFDGNLTPRFLASIVGDVHEVAPWYMMIAPFSHSAASVCIPAFVLEHTALIPAKNDLS